MKRAKSSRSQVGHLSKDGAQVWSIDFSTAADGQLATPACWWGGEEEDAAPELGLAAGGCARRAAAITITALDLVDAPDGETLRCGPDAMGAHLLCEACRLRGDRESRNAAHRHHLSPLAQQHRVNRKAA